MKKKLPTVCPRCKGPVKPFEGAGGKTLLFHLDIGKPCIKPRPR